MTKHNLVLCILSFLLLLTCEKHPDIPPVLLLATDNNFGIYTGEVLRAEGFNSFHIRSVPNDTNKLPDLRNYDVIILAPHKIGKFYCEKFRKYVFEGGILIAFRPDTGLYDLFGISGNAGQIKDGYIAIDTLDSAGKGLPDQTIQFHGISEKYTMENGTILATLCEDDGKLTDYPALVSNTFGSGIAFAFSYNISENIVLTRQGNPLAAGKELDGINGIRAMDLFTGGWVDTSKNVLNQADVHMNLLSHCIETQISSSKPLPRLWYFPDNLRCLVTLTNDGEFRSEGDFEEQFSDVDSLKAKMTLYVLKTDQVSKDWAQKWAAMGFEISGHPDDTQEAGDPRWLNMHNALKSKKREIAGLYGFDMRTVVNHWFVWCGKDSGGNPEFAAQAMIEASQGLEMDINYAHYDNGSSEGHFIGSPGYSQGNYNDSGLAMKFADSRGKILNIYQHLNNVYDQQYFELNDPEGFFQCFKGLIDRSMKNEIYSFISIKSHNDEYSFSKIPLQKMIAYAGEYEVPVWTAAKLLDFLKAREGAEFTDIQWTGKKLSFKLKSSTIPEAGLTFLIPADYGTVRINRLTIGNKLYPYEVRRFKGRKYAFVNVKPGFNYTIEAYYK